MVTQLTANLLKSEPGEIVVEDSIIVTYRIVDVKVVKVVEGYHVAVGISISARYIKPPTAPAGICATGTPYRPASFRTVKPAEAVINAGGREIEIYTEPLAVLIAEGYVTPEGEPCVAIQTVTGWTVK
ncbi:MAG: hypothetical protein ACPL3C_11430 [Pyrobaculum sp.]|uniref:hypothetical protein n=1 Tax=Pyrobaculum sp. 3827-6 TaxID=2983604 RepID=UPI0021D93849|nr:hypothetical protein [Pyrobaculum sp. 3827-6]MCU7787674.1 hypothetical protein [Pyrobaculum sp. 3827-6]